VESYDRMCNRSECACRVDRREFIKVVGAGMVALAAGRPVMAGPFEASDFAKLIPADEKLDPEWVKSLFARGMPTIYRGAELEKIGMPVGGICAGQLYLGGDGRLWLWDIFNTPRATGDAHYAKPMEPSSPLDQGFAIRVSSAGRTITRALDHTGFSDITFRGEYPIGYVEYREAALPVSVSLEAFSPFIPLNADDSGLPVTIMRFTLKNTSREEVHCEIVGWIENVVCASSGAPALLSRVNRVHAGEGLTFLECGVRPIPDAVVRPPIVFADFEGDTYGEWTAEGPAFGSRPAKGAPDPVQKLAGFQGKSLANSWTGSDEPRGRLRSPAFVIERPFISFLIGGGDHRGETCINLVVDGKVVRTETGRNTDAMTWASWRVDDLAGRTAHIEIVDNHSGGWGHIDIDQIEFGDVPHDHGKVPLEQAGDFGTMGLGLLGGLGDDFVCTAIPDGPRPDAVFQENSARERMDADKAREQPPPLPPLMKGGSDGRGDAVKPFGQRLCGAVGRRLRLGPGQEAPVTFVVTWCFPNLRLDGMAGIIGRRYANRVPAARIAAEYVSRRFESLAAQTRLWHDTWYDSTLPYWFLDRTFANASTLATSTAQWLSYGRFYGWEGVGCCAGTCTHVWHYAHAVARLFPTLERSAREIADFGISFDPKTGAIDFRGEYRNGVAIDGQAGCVLRAYREHRMSPDDAFLKRNWAKIRKALAYLIAQDGNGDGILEGSQHNTLDAAWFGPVAWLSSLYLAALRAGEEMAHEMGDEPFAGQTRAIFEKGRTRIVELLWNGEYFVQKPDPKHAGEIGSGDGCEIDQVFGQSWAFQVALGRIIDEEHARKALQSLWRYNFTPDVGPYRDVNKSGRWYAMAGEGGLIMCTWPKGRPPPFQGPGAWATGYFNECMSGFEYQVAGHMIWEGMVKEGLAITRAIHDRYHASRRNPWNEVECGDHYARAMASYGVFLAACGYEYHGPKGYLAFAPRLTPGDFKAAFTAAEGWGTFAQKRDGGTQRERIEVKWGRLRLRTLAFTPPPDAKPGRVSVMAGGRPVDAAHVVRDGRVWISLAADVMIEGGQSLDVTIT
jgi:non-lysosomal glucosylceramidase